MSLATEHRAAPRFLSGYMATVRRAGPPPDEPSAGNAGRIINLSATGMQLSTAEGARRGERLRVEVPIPGAGPVAAYVRVMWCRANPVVFLGRYTCGTVYDPGLQAAAQRLLQGQRGRTAV